MKIQDKVANKLESQGYEGIDASLVISLFEQGLVVKELENDRYEIIFAVEYNELGQPNKFVVESVDADLTNNVIEESWFDRDGFFDFVGDNLDQWKNRRFVVQLHDLMHYYDYRNFFGNCIRKNAENLIMKLNQRDDKNGVD